MSGIALWTLPWVLLGSAALNLMLLAFAMSTLVIVPIVALIDWLGRISGARCTLHWFVCALLAGSFVSVLVPVPFDSVAVVLGYKIFCGSTMAAVWWRSLPKPSSEQYEGKFCG
jgi:hypothetical protein